VLGQWITLLILKEILFNVDYIIWGVIFTVHWQLTEDVIRIHVNFRHLCRTRGKETDWLVSETS
jgi:hypothetical protein